MLIKYFNITYLVETFLTNAKLIALLQTLSYYSCSNYKQEVLISTFHSVSPSYVFLFFRSLLSSSFFPVACSRLLVSGDDRKSEWATSGVWGTTPFYDRPH